MKFRNRRTYICYVLSSIYCVFQRMYTYIYIYTHHIKLVHVVLCCVSSDLDEIIWNYVMCFCFWIVFFKDSIPHSFVQTQSRCGENIFQESNIAMGTHFHIFRVVNTMKHGWPCSIFLICYNQNNYWLKLLIWLVERFQRFLYNQIIWLKTFCWIGIFRISWLHGELHDF